MYDGDGNQVVAFPFGPEGERREYRVIATDVDLPRRTGHRGTYFADPDGVTRAFDWLGNEYPAGDELFESPY